MAESGNHGSAGGGIILGIESSCDETAAAVVVQGVRTLSNVVASQIATHSRYGGVVPELASREHLRNIVPVVRAALSEAGITLNELDAIAVTEGPGLAGALLVGITYAKSLALALGKPLIAVNHLEGHIHAVLLEQAQLARPTSQNRDKGRPALKPETASSLQPRAEVEGTSPLQPRAEAGAPCLALESWGPAAVANQAPLLALVVSGGHTHLYLARCHDSAEAGASGPLWSYENVGRTVDDAAGEAFDKVAKMLGLGYPGGPWIDALAPHGDARAVPFSFSEIKAKVHRPGGRAALPRFLFSFSGIKTAVLRYVELHDMRPTIDARRNALAALPSAKALEALALCDRETLNLIASFQRAVVGDLMRKTFLAAESLGARAVLVSGGVAANRELRVRFTAEAAARNLPIAFPSMALSTDNAAMIAAAAWPRLLAGDFAASGLSAEPNLKLGKPAT
ncbi:MAG TPA: tRNA (adenosine(37)-N6)-threonylcarbamoyltransferase complex transferase subunit TsaD [Acidisarcina sp.]